MIVPLKSKTWADQWSAGLVRFDGCFSRTRRDGELTLHDEITKCAAYRGDKQLETIRHDALATLLSAELTMIAQGLWAAEACCQSPPEKVFLHAMLVIGRHLTNALIVRTGKGSDWPDSVLGAAEYIMIQPQAPIGDYHADVLVTSIKSAREASACANTAIEDFKGSVIIECDGHEFHEKTKEQVSRDKKRDREFQKLKYSVLRYSGSDIWRDPLKCAAEAISFAIQKRNEAEARVADALGFDSDGPPKRGANQ